MVPLEKEKEKLGVQDLYVYARHQLPIELNGKFYWEVGRLAARWQC